MKIRLIRSELIDLVILTWVLIFVLFQIWAHFAISISQIVIVGLMYISIFMKIIKHQLRIDYKLMYMYTLLFLFIFFLGENIWNKSRGYVIENIKLLFLSWSVYVYFVTLVQSSFNFINKYLKTMLIPLSMYVFFNTIIMFLQLGGTYFLMDTSTANPLYFDLITGIMGADGTHRVTIFYSIVFLTSIKFYSSLSKKAKKLVLFTNIFSLISSIYISTQNDNISFFLVIPMVFAIYYLLHVKLDIYALMTRLWKPFLLFILVAIFLFVIRDSESDKMASIVMRVNVSLASYKFDKGVIASSTDERFLLFSLALEQGGLWGKGIGDIQMLSDIKINKHFGMASIQSLVYMIGIIPYLLGVFTLSYAFCIKTHSNIKNCILIFTVLFFLSYYTQIFTVFPLALLTALLITVVINTDSESVN